MSLAKKKLLIIGGGAVSEKFHIPAAIDLLGVKDLYIAERDDNQRNRLADKFGLTNIYDDYKKVLEAVEFVIVATPPDLHHKIVTECINKRIPVLCEKPLTRSIGENNLLLETKSNNVLVGVCHTYRFFPNRMHVRTLIKKNYFGKNVKVDIQEGGVASWNSISGYTFRKDYVPGGVLLNEGIHSLDFLLWCFGKPIDIEYWDDSIGGVESNASMKLIFEHNSQATFRISRTCALLNKIIIKGDSEYVEFDIYNMNVIKEMNKDPEIILKKPNKELDDWTTIPKYQIEDFLGAIYNNKMPMCTMEEGANVVELVERCYRIKKGRPLPERAPIPGIRW